MASKRHIAKRACRCLKCGGRAVTFGSLTEADYYFNVLKPKADAGLIIDLEVHPKFKICRGVVVIADFAYTDAKTHRSKVIDVKGKGNPLTASFNRNRKLVKAKFGIDIEPVEHRIS